MPVVVDLVKMYGLTRSASEWRSDIAAPYSCPGAPVPPPVGVSMLAPTFGVF
jgi:hypothetical protein